MVKLEISPPIYRSIGMLGEGSSSYAYLVQRTPKHPSYFGNLLGTDLMPGRYVLKFPKNQGDTGSSRISRDYPNFDPSKALQRYTQILRGLDHPNIVQHEESVIATRGDNKRVCLVEEYLTSAVGFDDLIQEGVNFNNSPSTMFYFSQFLTGLAYLHSQGIVHRDLNPSNVVVHRNDDSTTSLLNRLVDDPGSGSARLFEEFGDAHVKIIDFGTSTKIGESEGFLSGNRKIKPKERLGDVADEIYACGVLMHLFLKGDYPFPLSNEPTMGVRQIDYSVAPDLSELSPGFQRMLAKSLGLEKEKFFDGKYGSVDELLADFKGVAHI